MTILLKCTPEKWNTDISAVDYAQATVYSTPIPDFPYKRVDGTIQIDKMLVEKPEHDNLGEEFCERIRQGCKRQGYQFKFYTLSTNPEFDYEVVVK